jgi:2-polyprenyl-6-methoxyphenol hydroxylase-like FAD-dependent oxidoreductase
VNLLSFSPAGYKRPLPLNPIFLLINGQPVLHNLIDRFVCYSCFVKSQLLTTQCVIAGGGPAGILLGYLLARSGIDVYVIEKWADFFRDFRGDTIHASTMEILKELGLLEEFLKLPHSEMTRMTFHFGTTVATVAELKYLHVTCPFIAFIPQWDFLNFLANKAKAYPNFHLLMETEATDLITEEDRIVGIRAKDKTGEFTIHADLVVGADGRHSTIREKGNFQVEELGVPIDVLWFRIGRSGADDKQSLGYLDHGAALVMLDRNDYWQCGFIIEKGGYEKVKAKGLEWFRSRVSSLGHVSEAAVAEIDSWDKVKFLAVSVDHVRIWANEGVVLIGDAAHAMSPLGGVGINYAIQDAVAAANILIPALKEGTLSFITLEKIQKRREKPTRRMQKLQVYIQDHVLSPVLHDGDQSALKAPWIIRMFKWFPVLRRIPGYIIGIGFGPEHVQNIN